MLKSFASLVIVVFQVSNCYNHLLEKEKVSIHYANMDRMII